jgi:rubrerythrin
MSMEIPTDPLAVLELALKNERTAHDLYLDAGEKATSEIARHTFRFLCDEEKRHMKRINEYFGAIRNGTEPGEVDETHSVEYAKAHLRSIFEQFAGDVAKTSEAPEQHLDAYRVALDIERTGYEFYKKAAAQAATEFGKRFFGWLTDEENAHYKLLDETYSFLERPEGYLAEMERWMQT